MEFAHIANKRTLDGFCVKPPLTFLQTTNKKIDNMEIFFSLSSIKNEFTRMPDP